MSLEKLASEVTSAINDFTKLLQEAGNNETPEHIMIDISKKLGLIITAKVDGKIARYLEKEYKINHEIYTDIETKEPWVLLRLNRKDYNLEIHAPYE